jgi:hypothetical protein
MREFSFEKLVVDDDDEEEEGLKGQREDLQSRIAKLWKLGSRRHCPSAGLRIVR